MDKDNHNHEKKPITLDFYPVMCKPSHPRKYQRPNVNHEENAFLRVQNLQCQENTPILTDFARVNHNQPRRVNANDIAVGQAVHGVIDAIFDDGYLLTVRVGNSEKTLRGVFKTGGRIPVAADNDVAPNVPMIRRNGVPLSENSLNQNVHNPGSRERNVQHFNSNRNQIPRLPVLGARHMPPVPSLPLHPVPKYNVMPPVVQPVSLPTRGTVGSRTLPALLTRYAPLEAFKGKQVQSASTSYASKPINQVTTVGNQALFSPSTSNLGVPNFVSAKVPRPAELNTLKSPRPRFENLPTDINGIHSPWESYKTQMKKLKSDNNDMDEPLAVEPLQIVPPVRIGRASLPKPS